jgi:hypothetical protein
MNYHLDTSLIVDNPKFCALLVKLRKSRHTLANK